MRTSSNLTRLRRLQGSDGTFSERCQETQLRDQRRRADHPAIRRPLRLESFQRSGSALFLQDLLRKSARSVYSISRGARCRIGSARRVGPERPNCKIAKSRVSREARPFTSSNHQDRSEQPRRSIQQRGNSAKSVPAGPPRNRRRNGQPSWVASFLSTLELLKTRRPR